MSPLPPPTRSAPRLFTRKEVEAHSDTQSCWTIIYDNVYDITAWIPVHPGGDLVRQAAGTECTGLFESSHPPYVNQSFLEKYKIGELHPEERDPRYIYDSEFWITLKKRVWDHFRNNKIPRHDVPRYYLESFVFLASFWLCYGLGLYYHSYVGILLAAILSPLCSICIMHDGQHGAASRYPVINHIMGFVIDLMGASGYVWKHEHNLGHHQYTNTDTDPDALSGAPWVRLCSLSPYAWYHKYQHIYVWILYALIMARWYVADIVCFFTQRFNGKAMYPMSRTEQWLFWVGKIFYANMTLFVPAYLYGWSWGLLSYATFTVAASYSFACQFTVNHLTPDLYWPTQRKAEEQERDWAKLQIMTASNYSMGSAWASFFSGGLNNQIEHHLFPTFCHLHYGPHISPIVRQLCAEHQVPYTVLPSYWDAFCGHYRQLCKMGTPPSPTPVM